jgi:hypothetical protein
VTRCWLRSLAVVVLLAVQIAGQQICNNGLPCPSTLEPMPDRFDFADPHEFASTLTVSLALPVSATREVILAFVSVNVVGDISGPVTLTPPSSGGWTSIQSQTPGDGYYVGVLWHQGTGAGTTQVWTFNQTVRGCIDFVIYDHVAESGSPIDTSSYRAEAFTQTSHTTQSLSTGADNETVIAGWFDTFDAPPPVPESGLTSRIATGEGIGLASAHTIADFIQGAAGSTGGKVATTSFADPYLWMLMVALKSYEGPSDPVLLTPTSGQIIIGVAYDVTWTPATSPTAAQSSLKYHIQYSADNGVSWSDIVSLTSAGVTTYSWSTTGRTAGTAYKVRIRSYDPATTLYSQEYSTGSVFSLVAETAPAPPTSLSPSTGAMDKSTAATPFSWLHSGGAGNPQTKFTLQWSRDAFASHTATVGPTTTSTQSTTVNLSGEADGATITWRIKTTGLTLDSAYSSNASFIAANAPATPNITAPTAGSPPTDPNPTYTFTESSLFTHRRLRLVTGGSQVYDSGFVSGTGLSFPSAYSLANGIAYTASLSVRNQYGLISAEDSETFTPTFTGPATPTITVTPNSGGFNRVTISNSGSPAADYNDVYRYAAGQTSADFIRVGKSVALNGTFDDYNVRSGIQYSYKARAVIASTLKFTDSTTSTGTVTLDQGFIHVVDRDNDNE